MNIVKFPHPALLKKSNTIISFDAKLKQLAQDMIDTMLEAKGIGLAANQVGVNLRIFVMNAHLKSQETNLDNCVFINPLIIEAAQEKQEYTEGCLSFPTLYIPVQRPKDIVLQWQDLKGEVHRELLTDLAAICAQHELDHLDGINYVDKIGKVKKAFALKKFYKNDKEMKKRASVKEEIANA